MPLSNYLEAKVLNAIFGNTALPTWSTIYAFLSTTAINGSQTDASILAGEPTSTGSYARPAVTNNSTNFPAATGVLPASVSWATGVSFATSTAAYSTGSTPLLSAGFADASTLGGGHLLWYGSLTPSTIAVNASGIVIGVAANGFTFSLL